MAAEHLEAQVLRWNARFPLDRWYRKKYNIPFGSEQHRKISQMDIYFDHLEDKMFEQYSEKAKVAVEKEKEFEKGIWLAERAMPEDELDVLWDKMDMSSIQIED
jgi:hypothetical protein